MYVSPSHETTSTRRHHCFFVAGADYATVVSEKATRAAQGRAPCEVAASETTPNDGKRARNAGAFNKNLVAYRYSIAVSSPTHEKAAKLLLLRCRERAAGLPDGAHDQLVQLNRRGL